jgi:hypothetical protein
VITFTFSFIITIYFCHYCYLGQCWCLALNFFGGGGVRGRYSLPFHMTWPLDWNLSLVGGVLRSGSKSVCPPPPPPQSLKMVALYSFEQFGIPNSATQCHIPEDLDPDLKYWWFHEHSVPEMKWMPWELKHLIKICSKNTEASVTSSLWCMWKPLFMFVTMIDIIEINLVCKEMVMS